MFSFVYIDNNNYVEIHCIYIIICIHLQCIYHYVSGKESILDSIITIICAYFVQYIHR